MEHLLKHHAAKPAHPAHAHEAPVHFRAAGDSATVRPCLACGQMFESEGWHNRLCATCRKRS